MPIVTVVNPDIRHIGIPGPLMCTILGTLWRGPYEMPLGRIHRYVNADHHEVAVTTVTATLGRLIERGWVKRVRSGVYAPVLSREQVISQLRGQLEGLIDTMTMALEEA